MNRLESRFQIPADVSPGFLYDDGPARFAAPDVRRLLSALWPHRLRIGAFALAGAAGALALALLLPPSFVASVALLEAPKAGGSSTLEQLGLSAEVLGLKNGAANNALTFPDILRSRRLLENLLGRSFAARDGRPHLLVDWILPGKASPQRTERAVEVLRRRLDIALDRRTNLLRLGVTDRDPVLAAGVANAAIAQLQELLLHATETQASANRRFIEGRLSDSEHELARAENDVRDFREANRHVDGSPTLALQQGRLLREMRTREEVVIALTRQYEIARVEENRDVPVLNVIDPAVPPAFKSAPRTGPLVAGGFLLGLAVGVALCWPRGASVPASEAAEKAA
jgi:uncharacterized protein involved in exopolysaccharide biosynthesis